MISPGRTLRCSQGKITAEIEITKHMFCVLLCRRGRVSAFCKAYMFFHSFIAMECVYIVFFTVNSSVNTARSPLNGVCRRKFHGNGIKLKTFPQGYVISLCGLVVRYKRASSRRCWIPVLLGNPNFFSFFLFFPSFVLLFSLNRYLNNCY